MPPCRGPSGWSTTTATTPSWRSPRPRASRPATSVATSPAGSDPRRALRQDGLDGADHLVGLRIRHRPEAASHLAGGGDQELLEVPLDVPGLALVVLHGREPVVEGVAAGPVDLHLLGHRERHAVGRGAERLDLVGRPRLLAAE